MKKIILAAMTALLFVSFATGGVRSAEAAVANKILIAYFSRTGENYSVGTVKKGNTQIIAEMIAEKTGGAMFRIETAKPYPENYKECVEAARKELAANARPQLKADVANFDEYRTIFIGYPIWCGEMPMAVYSFIEKHNFAGKTVVPFCTNEGSGLAGTEQELKSACKGAKVLKGLAVRGATAQNSQDETRDEVADWLKGLKITKAN
jgi:flavodoxin